jgi:phage terminase small subunit
MARTIEKKPTKSQSMAALKKPLTHKQQRFVEGVTRHGNGARAAREAGYSAKTARQIAEENLTKLDISEAIERRRTDLMRRAQIHTDVIIGSLAEIALASLGDVLDDSGKFSIERARANGVDHLLKKVKVTERIGGEVVYEYEMYSRLEALNQLRDTFGMKQEARPNNFDETKRKEVEAAINRIMERDGVDRRTAAQALLAELGDHAELAQVVSRYVN